MISTASMSGDSVDEVASRQRMARAGLLSIIIDVAILVAVIVTPPILQYLIRWNSDGNRETLQQYVKMFPHATKVPESVSEDGDAVPKM